jgi:chemotaxis protein MotB
MNRLLLIVCIALLGVLVAAGVLLYPEYQRMGQALQDCEKKLPDAGKRAEPGAGPLKSTQEKLLADLKDQIQKQEVIIKECQAGFSLTLIDRVLFEFGKATLTAEGKKILLKVGEALKSTTGKNIRVVGHADPIAIHPDYQSIFPTNWELSAARAATVVRFFQERGRLDPKDMEAVGRSFYEPVAGNETEKGRATNRRVEIIVAPKWEVKKG